MDTSSLLHTKIQTYVINLDRSPERLNNMRTRLSRLNLSWQRVDAVDGKVLPELIPSEVNEVLYERNHGKSLARAEVGCYLSHIRALRVFLQSPAEYALILEDDAVPTDDLMLVLTQLLAQNEQWDVVKLSGFHKAYPIKRRDLNQIYQIGVPLARHCNTAALLYNRLGAQAIIDTLLPMSLPFDHALEQPWRYRAKLRIVSPSPVAAGDGTESTITGSKSKRFAWYRRIPTYIFRIKNEIQRVRWAFKQ